MTTSLIAALVGLCGMGLLLACARRVPSVRRLLSRNLAAVVGTAAAAAGLALLAVVPISRYFSDAGRLWCGTSLIRRESWPAACDQWDLYAQRFDVARWPLVLGAVLVVAANLRPNDKTSSLSGDA